VTQYLNAFPFAPPVFVLGVLLAFFVSRSLARRLQQRRIVLVCWMASLIFILALTLTPSSYALSMEPGLPVSRNWVWDLPSVGALFSVNWQSLNLLMFMPIGVASALFARRRSVAVFAAIAYSTSVLVELIQYMTAPLARPQFNSATVVIGWFGITLGFAVCMLARTMLKRFAPHTSDDD
jgi:glycopeptide antibiotics resistance protein